MSGLDHLWAQSYPELDQTAPPPNLSFRPTAPPDAASAFAETMPLDTPSPTPPAVEGAPYRRLGILGEGGMGQVYRARQSALRREVALKTSKELAGSSKRFLSEALVTAFLDHPNIIPVYDLGDREGELELAMKLIEGRGWDEVLEDDRPWDTRERLDRHLEILLSVCDAVAFAHSRGIAHLDLKPENVMVGAFNEVLVLDWGLAHEFGPPSPEPRAPRAELKVPCGTPRYMPPELAQGRGEEIDARSDVYLLGGLLQHILSGAPPHRGDSLIAVLRDAVEGPAPEAPAELPRELRAIAERALAKERAARFATATELAEAVRDFRAHRDSLRLSTRARGELEAAEERDDPYAALRAALAGFEQSLALWKDNANAEAGRIETHRCTARAALDARDLALARSHVQALGEDGAALAAELDRAERAVTAARARQRWTRRGLGAAVLTIIVGLSYGTVTLRESERAARAAEGLSRQREVEAGVAAENAREAEREARRQKTKAEDALAAAQRNLTQVFNQAGRSAAAKKDFAAAELYFARSLTITEDAAIRAELAGVTGSGLRLLRAFASENGPVVGFDFDHDDRRIGLSVGPKGEGEKPGLEVFDVESERALARLDLASDRAVEHFALWPGRKRVMLVIGGGISLWDYASGGLRVVADRRTFEEYLSSSIRFDAGGRFLAVDRGSFRETAVVDFERGWFIKTPWSIGKKTASLSAPVLFPPGSTEFFAYDNLDNRMVAFPRRVLNADEPLEAEPERRRNLGLKDVDQHLAVSRDGRRAVGRRRHRELITWDLEEDRELARLSDPSLRISDLNGLSISADGRYFTATFDDDPLLRIWRCEDGRLIARIELGAAASFARFGRRRSILGIAAGGKALVFDLAPLIAAQPIAGYLRGPVGFDARSRRMVADSGGSAPVIAALGSGRSEPSPPGFGRVFGQEIAGCLGPEGRVYALSTSRALELRSLRYGERVRALPTEVQAYLLPGVGFPDPIGPEKKRPGTLLKALRDFRDQVKENGADWGRAWLAERDGLRDFRSFYLYTKLRFSRGGRLLALGRLEAHVWDPESGELLGRFPAPRNAAFLSDERLVCLAWREGASVLEFRELGGTKPRTIPLSEEATALVASPSSERFAFALKSGAVELWKGEAFERRLAAPKTRGGAAYAVLSLAFKADGSLLAIGRRDGRIALYDTEAGRDIGSFAASDELISLLGISPDGRWLVSCCANGRTLNWQLPALLRAFRAPADELYKEAVERLGLELDGFRVQLR